MSEGVEQRDTTAASLPRAVRLLGALVGIVAVLYVLGLAFDLMRDDDAKRLTIVVVAIAVGIGGVFALFWAMDTAVDHLPASWREGVRPYVFVGPALVILSVFLIYPVV